MRQFAHWVGYRFRLWCFLSLTRVKLAAVLASQILVTDAWTIIATFELPLAYGLAWLVVGRGYLTLTTFYAALIVLRVIWRVQGRLRAEKADTPEAFPLNANQQLSDLVWAVGRDFKRRPGRLILHLEPGRVATVCL